MCIDVKCHTQFDQVKRWTLGYFFFLPQKVKGNKVYSCKHAKYSLYGGRGHIFYAILFLFQVKRDCPKLTQRDSPLSSRNCTKLKISSKDSAGRISSTTDSEASHHETLQHLDDKIIGQHGGELLFHYPDTIKKGRIFGLIVQETQVWLIPF